MKDANVLKDFALDADGLSVLASLQLGLLEEDISNTKSSAWFSDNTVELQKLKMSWRLRWRGMVQRGFDELQTKPTPALLEPGDQNLESQLNKLRRSSDRAPAGLILVEMVSWDAYWPFEKDQKDFKDLKIDPDLRKKYLERAATRLGFEGKRAGELRDAIESAHKGLTGYWWKLALGVAAGLGLGALTLGIAAPFIGGAIGAAMGLTGAAATSAGLAALGGGAVAVGGLGMAGGTAVVVGGGAVLGMGAGGAIGRIATAMSAEAVLLSSAKLEVVLKEFILQGQHDTAKVQEILFAQRKSIHALEEELDRVRMGGNKSDERIEQLENAIDVMRKALKRNQELAA
ncbi:MAG TPA: hypothetical protein PLI95_19595 [Polyangiaceae bacterium]|nr:hypothetical protein [Polyangiaceae bacterium]